MSVRLGRNHQTFPYAYSFWERKYIQTSHRKQKKERTKNKIWRNIFYEFAIDAKRTYRQTETVEMLSSQRTEFVGAEMLDVAPARIRYDYWHRRL